MAAPEKKQIRLDSFFESAGASSKDSSSPFLNSGCQNNEQNRFRDYELRRKPRKFQQQWKIEFPWIEEDILNEDNRRIFCSICRSNPNLADQKSVYFIGTSNDSNTKTSALRFHGKSKKHLKCQDAISAINAVPGTSIAEKTLDKIAAFEKEHILKFLRTSHALAKHARPFKDFCWTLDLLGMCGANLQSNYKSDKQCATFMHYIAEVERKIIKDCLLQADFYSIIIDGTINVSVRDIELIYIRTSQRGVIHVFLLAVKVLSRPNATSIYDAIFESLSEMGIPKNIFMKRCVCFCADGAAVNFGVRKGVAQKLNDNIEWLLKVHCVGHRIELALKDVTKSVDIQKKAEQLLLNIYFFYHNSGVARSGLLEARKALGTKNKLPTRIGGTRWIEHTNTAVSNLLTIYLAVIEHLNQMQLDNSLTAIAKSKALGYLKQLCSRDMILWLHFLKDITHIVLKLSKSIQNTDCLLSDVKNVVNSTIASLKHYENDFKTPSVVELLNGADVFTFTVGSIDLIPLNGNFANSAKQFISLLIEHLNERFSDLENCTVTLAVSVFNTNTWPKLLPKDFGENELISIIQHYKVPLEKANIQPSNVIIDWIFVKDKVFALASNSQKCKNGQIDNIDLWGTVIKTYGIHVPSLVKVIDLVFTLQTQSAIAERGFSLYKLIHTDLRNGLRSKTITQLMQIRLHSPNIIQFDPEQAFQLWKSDVIRVRRPNIKPYSRNRNSFESDCDSTSAEESSDLSD